MAANSVYLHTTERFRLRVAADADPGALSVVLERFRNLNLIPQRVFAKCTGAESLLIHVDLDGMPEHLVELITAKIRQAPCILNASWRRVSARTPRNRPATGRE